MQISLNTARKLAIHCQGLDGRWQLPKGKEGVARIVERLGYVQIDTIAVVQRAHDHTLWSRRPDYALDMLHHLQSRDRRVFEYWTHAASYVPFCDYRYYLPRMQAHACSPRERRWRKDNARIVKEVLRRIRQEGPLGSADFEASEGKGRTWWGWKPAKQALEILFNTGELMVTARRNFQRLYDLPERVIPEGVDTTHPDQDELARFVVRRSLSGHGAVSADQICWRHRAALPSVSEILQDLVDAGEATPVEVKSLDSGPYFALTENLEQASGRVRKQLHILSPFDNLIIRRDRLQKLFDFDFKLECYLPAARRRYGYFCLPLLWGTQFVGRLDPKADRKNKALIVRGLIFEPDFTDYDALLPSLAEKLRAFAAFNECEQVVVEQTTPRKVKTLLKRALNR